MISVSRYYIYIAKIYIYIYHIWDIKDKNISQMETYIYIYMYTSVCITDITDWPT